MERRIFSHPIRRCTTAAFFPEPIGIQDFRETIAGSFDSYAANMAAIGADKPKYIEEWVEQYLAWLEIEESPGD